MEFFWVPTLPTCNLPAIGLARDQSFIAAPPVAIAQ
jgi:hypothetical protein